MTELEVPARAHTRLPPPSYSATPLPSYHARELSDSPSLWSGSTLAGPDVEATHFPSKNRHLASGSPSRHWRKRIWVFIFLALLAYGIAIGIPVGLCSRAEDFKRCLSPQNDGNFAVDPGQIHSFIKRATEYEDFARAFYDKVLTFIGIGLICSWVVDWMRRWLSERT